MGKSVLILLDTHIVLWVAFDAARLSKKAKTTMQKRGSPAKALQFPTLRCLS
jgi:PIN domain nuclease of toxin-antitoxin system